MKRRKKRAVDNAEINMTPMIDVVFQMIIFFVCTADMDRKAFDEKIRLAMSPHGPAEEKKDPRTVVIEVDARGNIQIFRTPYSYGAMKQTLRKAVAEYGQTVPVVIRGDAATKHEDIKRVMDAASESGLWKIKFAATKERVETVQK